MQVFNNILDRNDRHANAKKELDGKYAWLNMPYWWWDPSKKKYGEVTIYELECGIPIMDLLH